MKYAIRRVIRSGRVQRWSPNAQYVSEREIPVYMHHLCDPADRLNQYLMKRVVLARV